MWTFPDPAGSLGWGHPGQVCRSSQGWLTEENPHVHTHSDGPNSLEFGFWCAEDAVVIVQLRAAVARVLKLDAVQVQVLLLHLRGRLCRVLLRVQHLHTHTDTHTRTNVVSKINKRKLNSHIYRRQEKTHLIWNSEALQKSHHSLLEVLLLKHGRMNTQPGVSMWPTSDLLQSSERSNTETTSAASFYWYAIHLQRRRDIDSAACAGENQY